MAEKKPGGRTTPITMRISTKLLARLNKLANPYDLSRTELIHRAIEDYVERRRMADEYTQRHGQIGTPEEERRR